MDNHSTADHPPCPMCDPSLLPEGYDPIPTDAVMVRPDGTQALLRGQVKAYWNGIDVTNQAKEADVERGIIVAFHRSFGPATVTHGEHRRGVRSEDKPLAMERHFCNREGLDLFERPSVEDGGHACLMVLVGEVVVIDVATGTAPVLVDTEAA